MLDRKTTVTPSLSDVFPHFVSYFTRIRPAFPPPTNGHEKEQLRVETRRQESFHLAAPPRPGPTGRCLSQRDKIFADINVHFLPKSQTNHLQVIQNSLARAVVKAPKFCHVTPILKSLHWLKINECIEYKLLSLTYKALTTAQPLHSLISVQPLVLLAPHLLSPFLDHLHFLL